MKIYEVVDKLLEYELREVDQKGRPINRRSPRRKESMSLDVLVDDFVETELTPDRSDDRYSDVLDEPELAIDPTEGEIDPNPKWQDVLDYMKGVEMTLLHYVYYVLLQHGYVEDGKDFSENWCDKNSNWYSYQTHMGRTFSLDAAISCLMSLKDIREEGEQELFKLRALEELVNLLTQFLALKYRIADVADRDR